MKDKYFGAISAFMLVLPLMLAVWLGGGGLSPAHDAGQLRVVKAANTEPSNKGGYIKNIEAAPQNMKEYTFMVFMNGSDLETMYAAATGDLIEMAGSGFDEETVNITVFAGGSRRWHTEGIPGNLNTVYQLKNMELVKLAEAGDVSMGEPELLSEYISFTQRYFPAEKYALILWNHGGGAVAGYGADERYEDNPEEAALKLTDIDEALKGADMPRKLEILGFDTCLMSTIEMANIGKKYAQYLVASEEVEPEQGWDYSFLKDLSPGMAGYDIGRLIVDYYGAYYDNSGLEDFSTLSMTNLSKIDTVVEAFENLSRSAGLALNAGHYNILSRARSRTRSFGSGGEDGETDMVDILEMGARLNRYFPEETKALAESLENAVEHKYESWDETIGGLSVYFPFYNKKDLSYNIETYREMNQMPAYTGFITGFSAILAAAPNGNVGSLLVESEKGVSLMKLLQADKDGILSDIRLATWKEYGNGYFIQINDTGNVDIKEDGAIEYDNELITLNGYAACLYDTNNSAVKRFTIPAKLNGENANLIAVYSDKYPKGRILGAIPSNENVFDSRDKKMITVKEGDKISLRYYAVLFDEASTTIDAKKSEKWVDGQEFTVKGELELGTEANNNYIIKLNLIDTQNNNNYIDLTKAGLY